MFLQKFVKFTAYIPVRLFYFLRIRNKGKLPEGPCILVSNHGSMMDPVLMYVALPWKQISFLCAPRLFQCPRICQAFLRKMGAIPLTNVMQDMVELRSRVENRGADHLIGFFSQGMISHTQSAFKPGAAMLAFQTGLPLIPVFLRSAPFFRGGSWICFGEAISVEKTDVLDQEKVTALTGEIRSKVYKLSTDAAK